MASDTRVLDRKAIEALIPHRDPFLFVDRVLERSADALVAEWDVPRDLPVFRGHYPANPLLPGVLVTEFAVQSSAILMAAEPAAQRVLVPVLTKIEEARFKRMVAPGETLRAEVVIVERLAHARFVKAHVTCGGVTVARLRFTVAAIEDVQR